MDISSATEMVLLSGGLSVSVDALKLGWDLEDRGFRMESVGDKLRVQPHEKLTPADVADIRRYRDELLAIARYEPPECA